MPHYTEVYLFLIIIPTLIQYNANNSICLSFITIRRAIAKSNSWSK